MDVFITAIFAAILVGVPTESATTTPGLVKGCTYNGQYYTIGQSFQPSPCEHCYCSGSGQPACAIADCFFQMCVDAVHDPKQCCPTCPNGPNCKAPDGHIIKQGDTYQMDAHTICSCNSDHMMFGANMQALCAVEAVQMVTPQVVS